MIPIPKNIKEAKSQCYNSLLVIFLSIILLYVLKSPFGVLLIFPLFFATISLGVAIEYLRLKGRWKK